MKIKNIKQQLEGNQKEQKERSNTPSFAEDNNCKNGGNEKEKKIEKLNEILLYDKLKENYLSNQNLISTLQKENQNLKSQLINIKNNSKDNKMNKKLSPQNKKRKIDLKTNKFNEIKFSTVKLSDIQLLSSKPKINENQNSKKENMGQNGMLGI